MNTTALVLEKPTMQLTDCDKIAIIDFSHCPMCDSAMKLKKPNVKKCTDERCGLTAIITSELNSNGVNNIIVKRRNPRSKQVSDAVKSMKYMY